VPSYFGTGLAKYPIPEKYGELEGRMRSSGEAICEFDYFPSHFLRDICLKLS